MMPSDTELLQQFSRTGDERAFGLLVSRHAPMTRGVVLRATGDAATADEVTQTVFALLARKARSLRHGEIAGWLHRTAFLEARNARRKAARYRQALEHYHAHTMTPSLNDSAPEEILPHLDDALTRLKPEERQLVVLRYYQGHSVRDIAAAAGDNEEACRKRLQRSLHRLGDLLRRRGLRTSTAGLAAVFGSQALCSPPASAATLASAALKTSTSLTSTALISHSLILVNTATAIKTTVAAAILAAIPVVWLWTENRELRGEVAALRLHAAQPSSARTLPEESARNPLAEARKKDGATAAKRGAAGEPAAATPADLNPLLSREALVEMMRGEVELRTTQAFNRLCAGLPDLSEDQKARLRQVIESGAQARAAAVESLLMDGNMEKLLNPEALSEADKAKLIALNTQGDEPDAAVLKEILTADQWAKHEALQETRRLNTAENNANDALRQLDHYVDLTPEQKDVLFQKLAGNQLSGTADTPGIDPREEVIRSVLTPQQLQAYDEARAQEKQAMEKLMQLVPKLPGFKTDGTE